MRVRTDLQTIGRIAADVIRAEHEPFEVVAVTTGQGEGRYAEIILTIKGCRQDPCTVLLGVLREQTEDELRAAIADKLREHAASHGRDRQSASV